MASGATPVATEMPGVHQTEESTTLEVAVTPTTTTTAPTTTSATEAPSTGAPDEGSHYYQEEELVEGDWSRPEVEVHEVKVESGEEEEDVVWKCRVKLYRWAPDVAEPNTFLWKERGLGDGKLLRHRETGKIRFLLRQEKTLKIVANHYVLEQRGHCSLVPNSGSEKIWCWSVSDFADNELKVEQFALKFGQVEQARMFKENFERCCRENAKAFGVVVEDKEDTTKDTDKETTEFQESKEAPDVTSDQTPTQVVTASTN